MIIFDEKKYAEKVLRNKEYTTLKNQGQERCAITRYLKYEKGYSDDEIIQTLLVLPMLNGEMLEDYQKKQIFQKIINKAQNYEYVKDIVVDIYKEEIDIINSVEDTCCRDLLFCCLVYYKWGCHIFTRNFHSRKLDVDMVLEDDKNISKIAKLSDLSVRERNQKFMFLFSNKYYFNDIINKKSYFYIPFAKKEGEKVISISNYDNILGELYIYNKEKGYSRCENCGTVIKKNNNKQKYCNHCARIINIDKTIDNRLKKKNTETLVK